MWMDMKVILIHDWQKVRWSTTSIDKKIPISKRLLQVSEMYDFVIKSVGHTAISPAALIEHNVFQ
jgi:hypothetical protein